MNRLLLTWVALTNLISDLPDRISRDDEGATAVEYGLMVALIAVAIFATVSTLGTTLNTFFQAVVTCLTGGGCAAPN